MNPYRTQRERTAWEAGRAFGRNENPTEDSGQGHVLTRRQVEAMNNDEINARWPEVEKSLAAGLPSGDDDE